MNKFFSLLVGFLVFFLLFLNSQSSFSQIIAPSGETDRPATQLVFWYDNDGITTSRSSSIQVTNISQTTSVVIHIQVFASFDGDDNIATVGDKVICNEFDFIDILTPRDTHVYDLGVTPIVKNDGETTTTQGDTVFFDFRNTKGFVVVTPVVGETDLTAVSFQNLMGTTTVIDSGAFDLQSFRLNAMGRDAVDLTTGEIAPELTILDGVANGFKLVQPDVLRFSFRNFSGIPSVAADVVDVVGINFVDRYGPPGLLGYAADNTGSSTLWNPFLFNFIEDILSCTPITNICFLSIGLENNIGDANKLLDNDALCSGLFLPKYPLSFATDGWSLIFVSSIDDLENQFGLFASTTRAAVTGGAILSFGGADWMVADGDEVFPEPPVDPIESPCDSDDPNAIIGTPNDDILNGTPGPDNIIGLGGNDTIRGFQGNDCIDGGKGSDNIFGNRGADIIFGGSGEDVINAGRGSDIVFGNGGSDIIRGGNGNDNIRGNSGDDELNGGNGVDILNGGNGIDICVNGETVINCE